MDFSKLQLNGCHLSVAKLPVSSSRRRDFTNRHLHHEQSLSRHRDKSGSSEPTTGFYATDFWHPFCY